MKFDWKIILILVLLAGIVGMILFWPKPQPSEREILQDQKLKVNAKEISTLKAQNQTLLKELRQDSVLRVEEKEAFKVALKRQSQKVIEKRVIVQPILDTIPSLKAFVEQQDSLIQLQADRIKRLEFTESKLEANMAQVTGNFQEQIKKLVESNQILSSQKEDLKRENRKERRKTKLFKVVAVVGTVGAFLFGTSL